MSHFNDDKLKQAARSASQASVATDPEAKRLPVWPEADTPCIGYCSTNLGDSVCMGCGRTLDEVDGWLFKSDEEKAKVWQRIELAGVGYRWQGK